MVNIYDYTDYRLLLKDLYEDAKKHKPFFSYRYIARKVGFSSAGFFSNILQGKRNISNETIFGFAELFTFSKRQTEFFELLVHFNQARQHERKRFYFEKLLSFKRSRFYLLGADQYEYFDKWYYVAIRELLNYFPFQGDFKELGRMLRPAISPSEAKKAVELLERLGLIERNPDGFYGVTDAVVTTGRELRSVAVHNFQRSTIDLAKESIDRFPRHKRLISTLTLNLSEEVYQGIVDKLVEFEREVLELVQNDTNSPDRIYQFNFQVFPLADSYDRDGGK
jgi:uncharacterized protein (TIGR02147 family)